VKEVRDSLVISERGYEGRRIYDIPAISLNDGKYTIPAVDYTYFDLSDKNYKTIKTNPLNLTVCKNVAEKEVSNTDIKNTKQSNNEIIDIFVVHWPVLICLVVIGFIVFVIKRYNKNKKEKILKKAKDEMAARKATERLQKAEQLVHESKYEEFYNEILQTLWGYLSDKMKIPTIDLSADKIKENLTSCAIDDQTTNLIISAIEKCEFERYSPGDVAGNMRETYNSTYKAIMEIERIIES